MGNLREQQSGSSKDNMLRSILIFLVVTTSFAIAYTQSPLFTSNQNQYFLHGLADAGFGNLSQDWLANTLDPTPVFSLLVSLTDQLLGFHYTFYFYYALLMGVYLFSLVGIVLYVYDIRRTPAAFSLFIALLILIHSAGLRFLLSRTLGINWAYILEDGLADQRILGPVFQPSTFGVLLILSIYLYLHKHPYLAVLSAVIAATVHPTYLLSAALLSLSFMVAAYIEERKFIKPLLMGGLALLTVSPILYYVLSNFASTHPESTALAREILVNFRIPHHAQIDWWFDATAVIKILFVVAAIYLVRKLKPLFIILVTLTTAAAGLTIAQLILDSDALALIFPWRVSTILVPVSVSIIIGYLVLYVSQRFKEQFAKQTNLIMVGSLVIVILSMLVGLVRLKLDFDRKASADERQMMAYVATNNLPDEIYLTPIKMQDFRLEAGAPVYVDFKSIPYRDDDVLEWYRRVQFADQFYKTGDCDVLYQLSSSDGVTHAIVGNNHANTCQGLSTIYQDEAYTIYELRAD